MELVLVCLQIICFFASDSSTIGTQAAQGVPDSKKVFFDDTKKSARDLARDDLIEVLTGKSGEAVDWLKDYAGLELTKLGRLGGHSEPRTHRGTAQFP